METKESIHMPSTCKVHIIHVFWEKLVGVLLIVLTFDKQRHKGDDRRLEFALIGSQHSVVTRRIH